MLANLKEVLAIAEKENYAIGTFNAPGLENLMAVIHAAEKFNVPVIITHAQLHEPVMPLEVIGSIMVQAAEKAKVPVCVHLDHGETLDYLQRALEIGFTSIMYDGSVLPYEENVANTKKAVALAKPFHAGVEGELGTIVRLDKGTTAQTDRKQMFTDPDQAKEFVEATGIDALAASFGAMHGSYLTKPKLDFERIDQLLAKIGIPLVMHGGSGISAEDCRKAITKGVRKINYYSSMARAGVLAAKQCIAEKEPTYYHEVADCVMKAMQADVEQIMKVYYGKE